MIVRKLDQEQGVFTQKIQQKKKRLIKNKEKNKKNGIEKKKIAKNQIKLEFLLAFSQGNL
jgi:hypothetical protein